MLHSFLQKVLKQTLRQIGMFGSYPFMIVVILFFLFEQKYFECIFLCAGLVLSYTINSPLRLLFYKERPEPKIHTNILEKIAASSFPSGHATRSTFLFLFFLIFLPISFATSFFISLLYGIILVSRILRRKHYITDILGGVALGSSYFAILYLFLI